MVDGPGFFIAVLPFYYASIWCLTRKSIKWLISNAWTGPYGERHVETQNFGE